MCVFQIREHEGLLDARDPALPAERPVSADQSGLLPTPVSGGDPLPSARPPRGVHSPLCPLPSTGMTHQTCIYNNLRLFLVGAFINKRVRLLQSLVFLRQTRSDER